MISDPHSAVYKVRFYLTLQNFRSELRSQSGSPSLSSSTHCRRRRSCQQDHQPSNVASVLSPSPLPPNGRYEHLERRLLIKSFSTGSDDRWNVTRRQLQTTTGRQSSVDVDSLKKIAQTKNGERRGDKTATPPRSSRASENLYLRDVELRSVNSST